MRSWRPLLGPTRPAGAGATTGAPFAVRGAWWLASTVAVACLLGVAVRANADDDGAADQAEVVAGAAQATSTSPGPSAKLPDGAAPNSASPTSLGAGGAPTTAPPSGPGPSASGATTSSGPPPNAASTTTAAQTVPSGPASSAPAGPAPGNGNAAGSAACQDGPGDRTTEAMGDIDLLGADLRRDGAGLHIAFRVAAPPPPDAVNRTTGPGEDEGPAVTSWGVFLADGTETLYGIQATRVGQEWSATLVDFRTAAGDRTYPLAPVTGTSFELTVPGDDLHLPPSFAWWAWTDTDRRPPRAGDYLGDDCPNGSSETAGTTSNVANFPG